MNKKLIFWAALNDTNNRIKKEIEIFTNETGIKVEVIEIPWGKMWEYIITSIKENYKPDVIQLGNSWVSILTSIGYLKNITDIINNKNFIFNISPQIRAKYFSVPWFLDIALIFYNKKKYTGVEPFSLQTLDAHVKKNKDALILGGKKENILIQYLSSFIWKKGTDYINKGIFDILNEKTYNGILEFFKFIDKYAFRENLLNKYGDNIVDFFINEKGIFTIANTWTIQPFIKQEKKEKTFSATNFNCSSSLKCNFIGGSCLAITKETTLLKESKKLIKFLLSENSQKRYISKIGMIPVLKKSFNDTIKNFVYSEAIKSALEKGRTYPAVPYWGSFEQIIVTFIYNTLKSIKLKKFSAKKLKKELITINSQINFLISLWKRN